jgi:hypothetical protein
MLNPSLTNFKVMFTNALFPDELCKKYNDFLFHQNYPFKTIIGMIMESIQSVTIPGIGLNLITVPGIENTGKNPRDVKDQHGRPDFPHTTINRYFPGTAPLNEVVEGAQVTIGFRNYLINWTYFFEVYYSYYRRSRTIEQFDIILTMLSASEVPIIRFQLGDCFVSGLPNLVFSYTQQFNESSTFDLTCTFNKYDVAFIAPYFDITEVFLKEKE